MAGTDQVAMCSSFSVSNAFLVSDRGIAEHQRAFGHFLGPVVFEDINCVKLLLQQGATKDDKVIDILYFFHMGFPVNPACSTALRTLS